MKTEQEKPRELCGKRSDAGVCGLNKGHEHLAPCQFERPDRQMPEYMQSGPAQRDAVERWSYMVWGALIAFVRADGTATEPADVRAELHRLVRSEYDAWQAIAAATGARKFDRVTAALARLRELHP